jgi:hypothetical protein
MIREQKIRMTLMRQMTGSCLCGQVRYSAEVEPMFTAVCHCRNCQKQAGTAFTIVVAIPKTALKVTGRTKTFNDTGGSGNPVYRHFCPECGSPIASDVAVMPDITFIKAGTLDDTQWLAPTMELFCASAQPWVGLSGEMRRFAGMPT